MRQMLPRARFGFTLIELLVVIAIIAILAAILFPVFAKAREKARQTACLSDAKQMGLAFLQYNQDYDERNPSGTQPSALGWAAQLYSYVKSTSLYQCPDDPTPRGTNRRGRRLIRSPMRTMSRRRMRHNRSTAMSPSP